MESYRKGMNLVRWTETQIDGQRKRQIDGNTDRLKNNEDKYSYKMCHPGDNSGNENSVLRKKIEIDFQTAPTGYISPTVFRVVVLCVTGSRGPDHKHPEVQPRYSLHWLQGQDHQNLG